MGQVKKPRRVKLIIGMLAKNKKLFDMSEEFFIAQFGPIDYRSDILPFNHTDYYKKEMHSPLKRRFISFQNLISPDIMARIKLKTNSIEEKFSLKKSGGLVCRTINIDPGYISDSKLVLATTKDYFHRIYVGKGIYEEVTLRWRKGTFEPFEWTYPDYKTKEYIDILNKIRGLLRQPTSVSLRAPKGRSNLFMKYER